MWYGYTIIPLTTNMALETEDEAKQNILRIEKNPGNTTLRKVNIVKQNLLNTELWLAAVVLGRAETWSLTAADKLLPNI